MSLTKDDLNQISQIVRTEVSGLRSDMDRMESRITTAISLLQRDTYSRLDDHEVRITKLEQATPR